MRAKVFYVLPLKDLKGRKENLNNRNVTQLTHSLDWLEQLVMYFCCLISVSCQ